MTTAAIDLDALNELFEYQNKLDDVFSSIFDEDLFLSSSKSSHDHERGNSGQNFNSNEDLSFKAEDNAFVQKKRSIANFIMPVVVEIVALSYVLMYFT